MELKEEDLDVAISAEIDQLLALLRNLKKEHGDKVNSKFLLNFTAKMFNIPDDPEDMRGPLAAIIVHLLARLI